MHNEENQDTQMIEPASTFQIHGDASALFTALAEAQSNFGDVKRTKTVEVKKDGRTLYTHHYAPLDVVKAATVPALNAAGFAVIEPVTERQGGGYELRVLLCHSSGGRIEALVRLPREDNLQRLGSAITYLRRYLFQSLVGVVAEMDDDGNAAVGNEAQIADRQGSSKSAKPPSPAKASKAQEKTDRQTVSDLFKRLVEDIPADKKRAAVEAVGAHMLGKPYADAKAEDIPKLIDELTKAFDDGTNLNLLVDAGVIEPVA